MTTSFYMTCKWVFFSPLVHTWVLPCHGRISVSALIILLGRNVHGGWHLPWSHKTCDTLRWLWTQAKSSVQLPSEISRMKSDKCERCVTVSADHKVISLNSPWGTVLYVSEIWWFTMEVHTDAPRWWTLHFWWNNQHFVLLIAILYCKQRLV